MNKDEARLSVMGAISMALKDPILQQGFEIICKENAELKEKYNELSKVVFELKGEFMACPLDDMNRLSELIDRLNNL